MENKKQNKEVIKEYISRKVTPIFNEFLKENAINPMTVGNKGIKLPKKCYYQPHNYRLYFPFSKTNFKPTEPYFKHGFKIVNKTELQKEFLNCKIRVKKQQIEIINKINHNNWYPVEISEKAEQQIISIIQKKDRESIDVLRKFIKKYGGNSDFNILNRHSEDKVQHEDFIDLLPLKMKFHNKLVKKVYNEANVEFSNPVLACNYITNRSLENITPSILKGLNDIKGRIDTISPIEPIKTEIRGIIEPVIYAEDSIKSINESIKIVEV